MEQTHCGLAPKPSGIEHSPIACNNLSLALESKIEEQAQQFSVQDSLRQLFASSSNLSHLTERANCKISLFLQSQEISPSRAFPSPGENCDLIELRKTLTELRDSSLSLQRFLSQHKEFIAKEIEEAENLRLRKKLEAAAVKIQQQIRESIAVRSRLAVYLVESVVSRMARDLIVDEFRKIEDEEELLRSVTKKILSDTALKRPSSDSSVDPTSKRFSPTERQNSLQHLAEAAEHLTRPVTEPSKAQPRRRASPSPPPSEPAPRSKTPVASRASQAFVPGLQVVAKAVVDGEQVWILGTIQSHDPKRKICVVEDVEDNEAGAKTLYTIRALLGETIVLIEEDPTTKFAAGSEVLALFPETTCFYSATVVSVETEAYTVQFEEDYVDSVLVQRSVPRRYVLYVNKK